jgi:hydroxymethylglutaryl-CoA lyase
MDLGKGSSPVAKGGSTTDAQFTRLTRLFEAIDKAPQVTIAVVQGPAFGGGVGLAFACDIRIMAPTASIRLTEVRLGLAPATISKYVTRELGIAFTREAMLSARTITSQELLRLGKVAFVIEPGQDLSLALDGYLTGLKQCAPHSSSLTKELVRLSWEDGRGGTKQEDGIRRVFNEMMLPDSEAAYGLETFQSGVKDIDWDSYILSKAQKKSRL